MQKFQLACALAVAIVVTGAMLEAKGKPSTVPVGPPSTPVAAPATPPVDPPDSLVSFVCSMLPVPYLCD
jgi:hypothetical protein